MATQGQAINAMARIADRLSRQPNLTSYIGSPLDFPLFYYIIINASGAQRLWLALYKIGEGAWAVRIETQNRVSMVRTPIQVWTLQPLELDRTKCPSCLEDCDGKTCPVDLEVRMLFHEHAHNTLPVELLRHLRELQSADA